MYHNQSFQDFMVMYSDFNFPFLGVVWWLCLPTLRRN